MIKLNQEMGVGFMRWVLGVFCALWLSASAQAGVVYNWENLTPTNGGDTFSGTVILSDEAWHSGGGSYEQVFSINSLPDVGGCPYRVEDGGIEDFIFGSSGWRDFESGLVDGILDAYCEEPRALPVLYVFEFGFIVMDGYLAGGINWFGLNDEVRAGGDEIWEVTLISSDDSSAFGGCAHDHTPECLGATGRWVLDASTVPVPEPSTWFLLITGISLLSFWKARLKPQRL